MLFLTELLLERLVLVNEKFTAELILLSGITDVTVILLPDLDTVVPLVTSVTLYLNLESLNACICCNNPVVSSNTFLQVYVPLSL